MRQALSQITLRQNAKNMFHIIFSYYIVSNAPASEAFCLRQNAQRGPRCVRQARQRLIQPVVRSSARSLLVSPKGARSIEDAARDGPYAHGKATSGKDN